MTDTDDQAVTGVEDPHAHMKCEIYDTRGNKHTFYKDQAEELVNTGNYSYEWPPVKRPRKTENGTVMDAAEKAAKEKPAEKQTQGTSKSKTKKVAHHSV